MLSDELYSYQASAVEFVLARPGSCLFLEQGTGKTMVLAAVMERMMSRSGTRTSGTSSSFLVVVPLANIDTTWARTLRKIDGLTICRSWDEFHRSTGHRVLLIHYEGLNAKVVKKVRRHRWDLIGYDESQRLKSRSTRQSRTAMKLTWVGGREARVIHPETKRVIMSGTPIESEPIDLWAQFRFALPEVFGHQWSKFERRWTKPTGYMGYKCEFRRELLPAFLKVIEPHILRIHKSDVLDLPPLTLIPSPVMLLGEQERIYEDLRRRSTTVVRGQTVMADLAITQLVRLQQVTGGFLQTPEGTIDVGRAKVRRLRALVAREDKPLVVFCKYRREVELITEALSKWRVGVLTGATKKKQRAPLLRSFQRGELDVLVCQVRVGGVGVDLYRAHVAIVYSTTFSYIDFDQLLARIHRHGQKHACRIWLLYANNTVDEEIYAAVSSKRKVSRSTLRRTSMAKPAPKTTSKPTVAAKPAPKPAAPPKAASAEKPAPKPAVERPKYGVPQLAEAMGIKPASVRVALRGSGIAKSGKTYGWATKAEMLEVMTALKAKSKAKAEKADEDADEEETEESDEEESDEGGDDE